MKKLIILDRDGVINHDSDDYIKSTDEWLPIKGSLEAIARLNHADYIVTVATNQSGIGRKLFGADTLVQIHNKMHRMVEEVGGRIDAVFFCPHKPGDACDCRKPEPGLYRDIADRFRVSLDGLPVIGDSLRDLQAALTVKAQPYLVRTGKGKTTETMLEPSGLANVPVFNNLSAVVDHLLVSE